MSNHPLHNSIELDAALYTLFGHGQRAWHKPTYLPTWRCDLPVLSPTEKRAVETVLVTLGIAQPTIIQSGDGTAYLTVGPGDYQNCLQPLMGQTEPDKDRINLKRPELAKALWNARETRTVINAAPAMRDLALRHEIIARGVSAWESYYDDEQGMAYKLTVDKRDFRVPTTGREMLDTLDRVLTSWIKDAGGDVIEASNSFILMVPEHVYKKMEEAPMIKETIDRHHARWQSRVPPGTTVGSQR